MERKKKIRNEKRGAATPLFSIPLWGQFDKFRITKFESFVALLEVASLTKIIY